MTEPVRQLGRYELLKRIAKGGMGEIWLARARGAGGFEKTCIIKTILSHLAEEEEFVTKFLDEGRIVVQLVHGNIVPVFDMGEENGEYYLAMEYIPGRDLREVTKRLKRQGDSVPVDLALFVTSEVCKGLDYAHRKTGEDGESLGIIHRDVSPSNVLISREGEVKLIDFGIARAAGRLGKTVSGRIQGKFCYMSPEQAGGKKLDGRSDIFSAGVVLYEMLTSFRPFEGDTDLESLDLVRQCNFDPASTLNPAVPPEVDAILEKALARDPDDRYDTIDRLQIDCLQYLYTTGTSPTPSELAEFLASLFPDGLEREELRSARDSSSGAPPAKMSLDDALDFELDRLVEGSDSPADESVDPLQTTAVGSGRIPAAARAGTKTGTAPPGASSANSGPTAPTRPDRPDAQSVSVSTGSVASERSPRLLVALLLFVVVGAALAVFAATRPEHGTAIVRSDPPGAQVLVDGAHEGVQTPQTLKLAPGRHKIELQLDGYKAKGFTVHVKPDQETKTPIVRLPPRHAEQGPREIAITARPVDAELLVDGARLGIGRSMLMLDPGEEKTVVIQREGCVTLRQHVGYAIQRDRVAVELDCDPVEQPDAGDVEEVRPTKSDPQPRANRARITVKSSPDGATIWADGRRLGSAPVTWTGSAESTVRFQAKKQGYGAVDVKRDVAAIRGHSLTLSLEKAARAGCLNLRMQYPFIAEVAIDGTRVGKEIDRLRKHELPAGEHTVRVQNDTEGIALDHTFTVDIQPGGKCALLVVDGRKL